MCHKRKKRRRKKKNKNVPWAPKAKQEGRLVSPYLRGFERRGHLHLVHRPGVAALSVLRCKLPHIHSLHHRELSDIVPNLLSGHQTAHASWSGRGREDSLVCIRFLSANGSYD